MSCRPRFLSTATLIAALALSAASAAPAEPGTARSAQDIVSSQRPELRLGIFAHDPGSPESGSVDVNGEVLAPIPVPVAAEWQPWVPRLQAGVTGNTAGRTSSAYAGLAWTIDIAPRVFIEASFGGALNNGASGPYVPADRSDVGCHAAFRESASLGFALTDALAVLTTVEHISNAGLCTANRGLTNMGVRVGYRF
jgi:hypothetical protein